tara:strand:+ start:126 stop:419 length:294 start_codon:yes stop_codon:yes gene_type:complete
MTNQPAPFRIATVFGLDITEERVARYLPSNYEVLESDITGSAGDSVIVGGHDVAGWTLESYIVPRLGSGGLFATEDEPEPTVWTDEADYRDSQASDQ